MISDIDISTNNKDWAEFQKTREELKPFIKDDCDVCKQWKPIFDKCPKCKKEFNK